MKRFEEELEDGMRWSAGKGPLSELDWIGVTHSPVRVGSWIGVAFYTEYERDFMVGIVCCGGRIRSFGDWVGPW